MEKTEKITLTNMCMVYDGHGNVLVEDKVKGITTGLVFPGGHVETHESIVDSAIREVYEETGLIISNLQPCGIKDWIESNGSRYMVFLYKTNTYRGDLKPSSEGDVFWMSIDELKKSKTIFHLKEMLNIFCTDDYSELYNNTIKDVGPVLK